MASNAASRFQSAAGSLASVVPKVPLLNNVQDFGDFLVRFTQRLLTH